MSGAITGAGIGMCRLAALVLAVEFEVKHADKGYSARMLGVRGSSVLSKAKDGLLLSRRSRLSKDAALRMLQRWQEVLKADYEAGRIIGECPTCRRVALVPVESFPKAHYQLSNEFLSDGNPTHVCHPLLAGCGQGVRLLSEVPA